MPEHNNNKTAALTDTGSLLTKRFEPIADELTQVADYISQKLTCPYKVVNQRLEHITARMGKMLRPAMVLLAGKTCGRINGSHIEIAAVTELIHSATLLHDDVIDEAENRRKTPTANSLWGNESAVLMGDFVLSTVFAAVCGLRSSESRTLLSETAMRICQGELLQNIQHNNWSLTEDEYIQIITDKTASLFQTCCYLGAVTADADDQKLRALADFGLNTGIAFQISDDLLDIIGNENKAGKTLGTDLAKRKPTLPVIHFLQTAGSSEKIDYIEQLTNGTDLTEFAKQLDRAGSLRYTQQMTENYCKKALQAIKIFDESPAKDALIMIAAFTAARCV